MLSAVLSLFSVGIVVRKLEVLKSDWCEINIGEMRKRGVSFFVEINTLCDYFIDAIAHESFQNSRNFPKCYFVRAGTGTEMSESIHDTGGKTAAFQIFRFNTYFKATTGTTKLINFLCFR